MLSKQYRTSLSKKFPQLQESREDSAREELQTLQLNSVPFSVLEGFGMACASWSGVRKTTCDHCNKMGRNPS
jgi:hypothetical protein